MNCRYGDNYIKQEKCKEFKTNSYGRCKYSVKYLRCPLEEMLRKDEESEMSEIMEDLSNMGNSYTWFSIGENNA